VVVLAYPVPSLDYPCTQSPGPTGNGVTGNCLSAPGVRGGRIAGVLTLLGRRVYAPGANGEVVRPGNGGLKGIIGDMRRGSTRPWKRALGFVLLAEVLLAVREWWLWELGRRGVGGRLLVTEKRPLGVRDSVGFKAWRGISRAESVLGVIVRGVVARGVAVRGVFVWAVFVPVLACFFGPGCWCSMSSTGLSVY
jgi:hypothetical protein